MSTRCRKMVLLTIKRSDLTTKIMKRINSNHHMWELSGLMQGNGTSQNRSMKTLTLMSKGICSSERSWGRHDLIQFTKRIKICWLRQSRGLSHLNKITIDLTIGGSRTTKTSHSHTHTTHCKETYVPSEFHSWSQTPQPSTGKKLATK